MKKDKLDKYYLILAALCFAISALGLQSNVQAAETIKLGVIAELTGGSAAWGWTIPRGLELAIEDAGAEVTVGGKQYKFELIPYDCKCTGTDAVAAFNRLISRDKVKFIFGPICSSSAMAVKELVVKEDVLQICDSYTPKFLDPNTKNIFRIMDTCVEYAPYLAKWVREYHEKNFPNKEKTYALLAPNDESGWTSAKYYSENLQAQGFKIVFKEHYERGNKEFVPLLTRMMAQNPTYLDGDGSGPGDMGLIVKQARQLGYKGQIMYSGGPGFEELDRVAGAYADGMIAFAPANTEDPKIKALMVKHEKKYKQPMNLMLPNFYMAGELFLQAIQRAGTVEDIPKLIKTIETMPFEGVMGATKWVGKKDYGIDHQILHKTYLALIKGGTYKIIGEIKID